MKTKTKRILRTNAILLAACVAVTTLLSYLETRAGPDSIWLDDWVIGLLFLIVFVPNAFLYEGTLLRRAGLSLVAFLAVAVAWVATLALLAQGFGVHFSYV